MGQDSALLKDLSMLQALFENASQAIMILGKGTLIELVNKKAENLTAYPKAELENQRKWTDLVLADDHKRVKKLLRMLKAGDDTGKEQQECRFVSRKGELLTVSLSGHYHKASDHTIISLQDITSQKENESILQAARAKAEASDRLKTNFLGNLSHEIRTPMNAIVGFASLLKNESLAADKKGLYLGQIIKGSTDLLQLIDKTILLSRIDLGQLKINPRQCFVNACLTDLYNNYRAQLTGMDKKDIQLSLEVGREEEDFVVQADSVRLMLVLGNLLENAIKFTSKGSISMGYAYLEEEMESGEDVLLFYVKDTGPGISKDKQELVFDRFVKLVGENETVLRGAGLGLAISKDLVRLMGGEIWVESSPGEGSKFYFTLPITYSKSKVPASSTQDASSTEPTDWSKHTVLLAEDMESNYLYIKELLSVTGIQLLRARDGLEALEIFEAHPEIDLVLMDILMPGLDGYEATSKIRELKAHIPVIAQTAFTFEGEIKDGLYAGCFNDYIMKPFTRDMLIANMKKFLSGTK